MYLNKLTLNQSWEECGYFLFVFVCFIWWVVAMMTTPGQNMTIPSHAKHAQRTIFA